MRSKFTPAESAVAALILEGKNNAEIAEILGIKLDTLYNRLSDMREKWHASCDRHLTLMLVAEAR